MTEQERERIARRIYERLTIKSGYTAKPWVSLFDWERQRFLYAADDAYASFLVCQGARIATGRAA
jgi:hypothetical protein